MTSLKQSVRYWAFLYSPIWVRPRLRIALVGNGPVDNIEEIDQHDLVIRFNSCINYGSAGRRIDVLVISNSGGGGKHLANGPGAIKPEALAAAKQFWLRTHPTVLQTMAAQQPERSDLWSDHTDEILQNRVGLRPWAFLDEAALWSAQKMLRLYGAAEEQEPSTGILTLFHIKHTMRNYRTRATLYGFTHEGWEGHPWPAERALIDRWRGWVRKS